MSFSWRLPTVVNGHGARQRGDSNGHVDKEEFAAFVEKFTMDLRFDRDNNEHVDKEEFATFVEKFTMDLVNEISKSLIVSALRGPALVVMSALVMARTTKMSSEKIPIVGKLLSKLPDSMFALAIQVVDMLMLQSASQPTLNR